MTDEDKKEGRWQGAIETKQNDLERRVARLEGGYLKLSSAAITIVGLALLGKQVGIF